MTEDGPRPVLVFAFGNPSRGDDALGPALLERLEAGPGAFPRLDVLTDFQLQIEHAMDLKGRELVLFVDADVSVAAPWGLAPVEREAEVGYTTHAMSPGAVLAVYRRIEGTPPPTFVLGIRGYRFELGEPISPEAEGNLDSAYRMVERLLLNPEPRCWRELAGGAA